MRHTTIAPLIRGLSFNGERGLIVQYRETYDGDCPSLSLAEGTDENQATEQLRAALVTGSGIWRRR